MDGVEQAPDRVGNVLEGECAPVGIPRLYHVEFWPIGNRFEAGHRIRLDVVGASGASKPSAPAVNTIEVGGTSGSRLLFPVLPGSGLAAALR